MPLLAQDRELPSAITNLRLCSSLEQCGVSVAEAFDSSTAQCLFVYDDMSLGYSDWTDREPEFLSKCFKAANPNGTILVLLPLDGRVIKAKSVVKGGVCDCMLLTDEVMSLVEFKTNATSTACLRIVDNATEAIKQLWHTFDGIIRPRCAAMSKCLEQLLDIDFHVVFDRELEVTGAKSSLMDLQAVFLEDKEYTLFFDNEKIF